MTGGELWNAMAQAVASQGFIGWVWRSPCGADYGPFLSKMGADRASEAHDNLCGRCKAVAPIRPHDYSNPYLRLKATGDIRCDACGHFESLAPFTCTPDPSWRTRIEVMIAEATRATPEVPAR